MFGSVVIDVGIGRRSGGRDPRRSQAGALPPGDFGLVKLRGPQALGAEALTVEGAFTGTPAFMPPEVALGAEPIDGRADIYALGCVAYWLLTGQRVFEGTNAMQMVIDHVRTRPVPPSRRTQQVMPDALEQIVLRCLEKDPSARPSSVSELSSELQALGIEGLWTEARAREWWRVHHLAAPRDEALNPRLDHSRDETLSQFDRMAVGGHGHDARHARGGRPQAWPEWSGPGASTSARLWLKIAWLPFPRGPRAAMCRNIRTLFNFEPPATDEEVRAASLQFVRKVSGFNAPSQANEAAFEQAVEDVTEIARRLVDGLVTTAAPRNREKVAAVARARYAKRFGRGSDAGGTKA